jgi:hypothetical protein
MVNNFILYTGNIDISSYFRCTSSISKRFISQLQRNEASLAGARRLFHNTCLEDFMQIKSTHGSISLQTKFGNVPGWAQPLAAAAPPPGAQCGSRRGDSSCFRVAVPQLSQLKFDGTDCARTTEATAGPGLRPSRSNLTRVVRSACQ